MSDAIHIVVCLKQAPDPEAPASSFKIDSANLKITAEGVPPVINPYDESALEIALLIKDKVPEVKISAIASGPKLARAIMMKSLAVGADELYLIEDASLEDADGHVTAMVLAAGLSKIGFDLVLCGRQASDTNQGGVGLALAEILKIPAVSWARGIEVDDNKIKVERIIPEGCEVLSGGLPALVTVSHEAGEMRRPKLTAIRKAKQKPIHSMSLADLDMTGTVDKSIECIGLKAPDRARDCKLIEGDTAEEAGANLAKALIEDGLV